MWVLQVCLRSPCFLLQTRWKKGWASISMRTSGAVTALLTQAMQQLWSFPAPTPREYEDCPLSLLLFRPVLQVLDEAWCLITGHPTYWPDQLTSSQSPSCLKLFGSEFKVQDCPPPPALCSPHRQLLLAALCYSYLGHGLLATTFCDWSTA